MTTVSAAPQSAASPSAKGNVGEAPEFAGEASALAGWSFHGRWIPGKSDHGQLYFNVSKQVHPRVRMGLDYRPLTDDVSGLINILAKAEGTEWYEPALVLGASNDDFGAINSYSAYGTLSKYVGTVGKVDVSAYAGATFIFDLDDLRPVGGIVLRHGPWSMQWLYSGIQTHATVSRNFGQQTLSFIMFDLELPGVAYSYKF